MVSGMAVVVRLCVVLAFVFWLLQQIRDGKRCSTVVARWQVTNSLDRVPDAGTVDG